LKSFYQISIWLWFLCLDEVKFLWCIIFLRPDSSTQRAPGNLKSNEVSRYRVQLIIRDKILPEKFVSSSNFVFPEACVVKFYSYNPCDVFHPILLWKHQHISFKFSLFVNDQNIPCWLHPIHQTPESIHLNRLASQSSLQLHGVLWNPSWHSQHVWSSKYDGSLWW